MRRVATASSKDARTRCSGCEIEGWLRLCVCWGSGGGVILQCAKHQSLPGGLGRGGGRWRGGVADSCSDKQKEAPLRGDKSEDGESRSTLEEFLGSARRDHTS